MKDFVFECTSLIISSSENEFGGWKLTPLLAKACCVACFAEQSRQTLHVEKSELIFKLQYDVSDAFLNKALNSEHHF